MPVNKRKWSRVRLRSNSSCDPRGRRRFHSFCSSGSCSSSQAICFSMACEQHHHFQPIAICKPEHQVFAFFCICTWLSMLPPLIRSVLWNTNSGLHSGGGDHKKIFFSSCSFCDIWFNHCMGFWLAVFTVQDALSMQLRDLGRQL